MSEPGHRVRSCGRLTERYVPPAPRDLPALRARLDRWLADAGPRFYLANALIGRQYLPTGMHPADGAVLIAAQERERVTSGDLYWVSAAMTDLAVRAAPALPSWNLLRHDLPSPAGLMVFEKPPAVYRNHQGRDVEIVAASWGPWSGPDQLWRDGGLWLTFYSHPAALLPYQAFTATGQDRITWAVAADQAPPILPDNEAGWPFGPLDTVPGQVDGTTGAWARVLRAAWRLMQQPLTEHTTEQAPRAARRRLARAGQRAPAVRVIHIRRHEHPRTAAADNTPGLRHYQCQWWVGGHWRTYWCGPGRARAEDRWISPYLAGPDGKPVRGTQRINVWDR